MTSGVPEIPAWLEPVRRAADEVTGGQLSELVTPEGARTREGAVLLLFGDGDHGHDLLLTERAHDMRSHPGQVSFPGGSVDAADASAEEAALREAREETGLDPAGVRVFGTLPQLWLPPSNFSVTPVLGWWAAPSPVSVIDPREVHAVYRVPVDELLDPQNRVSVRHPSGYVGPGFLIGEGNRLVLWGFTAGIISRLFDVVGWTRASDVDRMSDVPPDHMLVARRWPPKSDE